MRSTSELAPSAHPLPLSPAPESADEALARRIRRELDRTGYSQLRLVHVRTSDRGCVQLEGHVQSFYLKQVAQAAVLAVEGVVGLENRLQVCGLR